MILENKNFYIEIDATTGETNKIINRSSEMNWIIPNNNWGIPKGFNVVNVANRDDAINIVLKNKECLQTEIIKRVDENRYIEEYKITNLSNKDCEMNNDNFAIPFPYDCDFSPRPNYLRDTCISHIWCGGDCSWIFSVRADGQTPYLIMNAEIGSFEDYSLEYDISKIANGSFYRGIPLLHIKKQIIKPNESIRLLLAYHFGLDRPDDNLQDYEGALRVYSDKYTLNINEKCQIVLESKNHLDKVEFYYRDKKLSCKVEKHKAICEYSFNQLGEKQIFVRTNNKELKLVLNVIPDIDDLIKNRINFIVDKQQMHSKDAFDGAYLPFDNETNKMSFTDRDDDHNACRERLGMGVLVAEYLIKHYDEKIMKSLRLHRQFIEREILDLNTMEVSDNIGHSKNCWRPYNVPWVSTYYLLWYRLTKEKLCLEIAAKTLIVFFERTDHTCAGQCMEFYDIALALKQEGMDALYRSFMNHVNIFCDKLSEFNDRESEFLKVVETSWVSEHPSEVISYLSQGYLLFKNPKYLEIASDFHKTMIGFFAHQPDYHMHSICVRYWDDYWFGKYPSYGDLFPHYWSTLAAWGLDKLDLASGTDNSEDIKNCLLGNLCVFKQDGRAYNNYLYPHRIILYSSDPNYRNEILPPQDEYGKRFDPLSNDQDWAMFYYLFILKIHYVID